MFLNNFSVNIPQGKEIPGGYVELSHGQQYTLRLRNNRSVRCNAAVYVDGKHIGTFRLSARDNLELERPAHDRGKFTFYVNGSKEAADSNLENVAPDDLGLVSVIFTPEVEYITKSDFASRRKGLFGNLHNDEYHITASLSQTVPETRQISSVTYSSHESGGTGLSGESDQRFINVANINEDLSQQTIINLRLVSRKGGARPLTQYSTPVPPRV